MFGSPLCLAAPYVCAGTKFIKEDAVDAKIAEISARGVAFEIERNPYGGLLRIGCSCNDAINEIVEYIDSADCMLSLHWFCFVNNKYLSKDNSNFRSFPEVSRDPSKEEMATYYDAYGQEDNIRIIDFGSILRFYEGGSFLEYGLELISNESLLYEEFNKFIDKAQCFATLHIGDVDRINYVPRDSIINEYKSDLKKCATGKYLQNEIVRQILALTVIFNKKDCMSLMIPADDFCSVYEFKENSVCVSHTPGFVFEETFYHELIHFIHYKVGIENSTTFPVADLRGFKFFDKIFKFAPEAYVIIDSILEEAKTFDYDQLRKLLTPNALAYINALSPHSYCNGTDNTKLMAKDDLILAIKYLLNILVLQNTWLDVEEISTISGLAFYENCVYLIKMCEYAFCDALRFGHSPSSFRSGIRECLCYRIDDFAKEFWYSAETKLSKFECILPDVENIVPICKIYYPNHSKKLLDVEEVFAVFIESSRQNCSHINME